MSKALYFVTDIEADGPTPLENSMLSFATVVVNEDGELIDEFEAVLKPRPDKSPNAKTMAWWKTQPHAWKAATTNPVHPKTEMRRFADWVEGFDGKRSFAARPVAFDGFWMDCYLRDFAESYLLDVPHWGRNIFTAGALDIGTYICGLFNHTDPHTGDVEFPADWLGNHEHTHRAIDDARGYASLLSRLLQIARRQPPHNGNFLA